MSSSLPLPLNCPLHHKRNAYFPSTFSLFSTPKPSLHVLSLKSIISYSSIHSDYDREEIRWLREEQRWFREEQRWLREEQRWSSERESLLREISDLKLQIQTLERQNLVQGGATSVSETITTIAGLLQALNEKNLITDSGSSASSIVFEEKPIKQNEEVEKDVIVEEVVRISDREKVEETVKKKRRTLRKGSEGEEIRAMQEALQKLGFYSGEEDMEFSSFSSGTERAVKTWQATLGAPEDGIMTAELLERLYVEKITEDVGFNQKSTPRVMPNEGANGAAVASVADISEVHQKVIKEQGVTEVEVSQHRVFLLGENRWEEPSRLAGIKRKDAESKGKGSTTKCLTCRGESRLMCTECDGTGEPNIEPQFLEWVGDEAKCPYCEGNGYTICDVCKG